MDKDIVPNMELGNHRMARKYLAPSLSSFVHEIMSFSSAWPALRH